MALRKRKSRAVSIEFGAQNSAFELEKRVVLSTTQAAITMSLAETDTKSTLATSRVSPNSIRASASVLNPRLGNSVRTVDRINAAFNSFQEDYLKAQATYIQAGASSPAVFKKLITERVRVLSQDLTRTLLQLPNATSRERGANQNALQSFLSRQILSSSSDQPNLKNTLTDDGSIPPPSSSVNEATANLYILNATNAIESARTATINATQYLVGGYFKPNHK